MAIFPPTLILRHSRENLKKCSLKGLETREDFLFYRYPQELSQLPSLASYVLLTLEAPLLTIEDASYGLLLLDGTWRYAARMRRALPPGIEGRSLPSHFRSAYPRTQTGCPNPEVGLASIEALFIAYHILFREKAFLLDGYFWKEPFLAKNRAAWYPSSGDFLA